MRVLFGVFFAVCLGFIACGKKGSDGGGGTPTAPTGLSVTATVAADSSGSVAFVATATGAASYDYDFGNGVFQTVPGGSVTYKYTMSGTYSVNVVAKGSGGLAASKTISVVVAI
ncbi:MAG: PKD domain-containing protein, partial [Bacteroidetes bacterium]|nr:PKD domain-containing protein [Bacteroidota bacterium]